MPENSITASELIEKLKQIPDTTRIYVTVPNYGPFLLKEIELEFYTNKYGESVVIDFFNPKIDIPLLED